MKTSVLTLGLLLACHASPAADLTLTDGRIFHDASILSQTPRTVVIQHTDGLSGISKTLLPAELSARYPIDEAAAREAELQAVQAQARAQEFHQTEAERSARLRLEREQSALYNAQIAAQEATARLADAEAARIASQHPEPVYDYIPFYQSRNYVCAPTSSYDNRWPERSRSNLPIRHDRDAHPARNSNTDRLSPRQNPADAQAAHNVHHQPASTSASQSPLSEETRKPLSVATLVIRR